MMADWEAWLQSRPRLAPQEEHTATLLHALWRIRETAPFAWGLTGGTALQSFFDEGQRRYSNDVEIITIATRSEVEAWMREQGWTPQAVGKADILKAALEPDGTLFVIHDYGPEDYAGTAPKDVVFGHYPLRRHPPPEELVIPLLDYEFLVATKVFGVREPRRGGERFKDAHDLAIGLAEADLERVTAKLDLYRRIRKDETDVQEIVRQAGAWLQHFLGRGRPSFENWRRGFVADADALEAEAELAAALHGLEEMYGAAIEPGPGEQRRFLLAETSPKRLAPLVKRLGYKGSLSKEFEKMADFVATKVFAELEGPIPDDADGLVKELEEHAKNTEVGRQRANG